jgi:hypothetical protein
VKPTELLIMATAAEACERRAEANGFPRIADRMRDRAARLRAEAADLTQTPTEPVADPEIA